MIYALTVAACLAGAYFWKQAKNLAAELDVQKTQNLEKEKLAEKMTLLEAQIAIKEKELLSKNQEKLESKTFYESQIRDNADLLKKVQDSVRLLENQRDHYKDQTEALLVQIRELDAENSLLKKTADQEIREKTNELAKTIGSSQEESRQLRASTTKLEAYVRELEKNLSEVQKEKAEGMELLKRLKHRTHQSDHLYKTIRGQKEMLEERLENWEKALRLLSLWVLRDKEQTMSSSASLGEIVSAALQSSQQGPLVCDDVEVPVKQVPVFVEETASV